MIAVVDYHKGNLKSVERGLIAAGAEAFVTDDAGAIARADAIVLPGVGAFADAASTMRDLGQTDVIRRRIAAGVPFLGICLGMHLMFEEGVEGAPEEDDETSTHNAPGLSILPGVVAKMPPVDQSGTPYKVPHVGWNTVGPTCSVERTGNVQSLKQSCSHESATTEDQQSCSSAHPLGRGTLCVNSPLDYLPCGTRLVDTADPFDSLEGSFASPLFEGIPSGTYFYFTHSFIAPDGPFAIAKTTHSVTFPCAVHYGEVAFGVQFHPEKSSDAGARLLRNFVNIAKGA